jgi:CheY-like chemotaxis protein
VGYVVFPAANGLEALQELKRRHYDVILSDYQMPMLNGLELLALSRRLLPSTPVILMSGIIDQSLEQTAVERGAFAWIHKPMEFRQVRAVLRAAVNSNRSSTGYQTGIASDRLSGSCTPLPAPNPD